MFVEIIPLRGKFLQFVSKDSGMQGPWLKRGVGIAELCGSRILPLPDHDAKFFESSKIDEDGPSRAGRPLKTFPEVPILFRVSRGKSESRLHTNDQRETWDIPELLTVSGS